MADQPFQQWAIVELMGHRRMAGLVTEQEIAGHGMLRIDVPQEDGTTVTQFYSPSALYCLTPVSAAVACAYAQRNYMPPVSVYDLALPGPAHLQSEEDDDDTEF